MRGISLFCGWERGDYERADEKGPLACSLGLPSVGVPLDIPEGLSQFGSFKKQMPRWNETCKRFIGDSLERQRGKEAGVGGGNFTAGLRQL